MNLSRQPLNRPILCQIGIWLDCVIQECCLVGQEKGRKLCPYRVFLEAKSFVYKLLHQQSHSATAASAAH